jgi:hypothetical protein
MITSVGIDFGFGSCKTAIVMTEHVQTFDYKTNQDRHSIIVRYSEEFEKSNPSDIVEIYHKLYVKHWIPSSLLMGQIEQVLTF